MNLAHYDNFYPTFVDAGIPTLYHSKPKPKWINLATKNIVAGKSYSFSNSETYFWAMTASNAKSGSVIVSDGKIVWKAKKTTYTKPKKTVYYVKKKVKGKWRWKKVKQGRYGKS